MDKYTNNLDVPENNLTKHVWLTEGAVFSGDTKYINKKSGDDNISPLLGAAILGLNNTAAPATSTNNNNHYWTDIDAQEDYLNSKPTCYLILGKPGLGAYSLGESIAKKYNCIHLCPKNIIMDEIMQGSSTGKCLDFNMKHNKVCSHKTILKILKRKLESSAVQHRGYIISGIPMVTAHEDPAYLLKMNHSEDAIVFIEELLNDLIFNLKRKKPKRAKPTTSSISSASDKNAEEEIEDEEEIQEEEQLEEAEEEELVAELPKYILDTCSNICYTIETYFQTKQTILVQQFEGLFNLSLKPDIIFFFTCPDADVITKKCQKFVNYKNLQNTVEPFPTKAFPELRWPTLYNLIEYENPRNIHAFNPKYNCRPPLNFSKKSEGELCNYRNCILPLIEKALMDYDPNQVIKLDGRTSTYQMMHQVTERLLLMDVKPVIIPEPLYMEEPSDDFEEFWKTVEESHVIKSGVRKFGHYASPWLNRCPVDLKKRKSVIGKQKLAVKFLKHVYLLSSISNFVSFCRNPRPFLKLEYLEPTCRIVITGTKSSGKTMTAECLSWIFDTPVYTFTTFVENNKELKYQMFAKTILSEISATIEDMRYIEWQQKESDREARLNEWNYLMFNALKEYVPLLKIHCTFLKQAEEARMKLSEEELEELGKDEKNVEPETPELPEEDPEFVAKLNSFRNKLSFLPILDNVEDCETILKSNTLLQYAPLELITITEKPALPVLGDEDVTNAISGYIVTNDLQKELEPTTEEIMDDITKFLSTLDDTQQETNQCYGKYIMDGFPSEPDYWEYLTKAKLIPDYTITIMENREIEPELMLHYLNIEKCVKNHQQIFSSIKDPLIISKLQTKQFPDTKMLSMKIIANDIVNNSLQSLVDPENINEAAPTPDSIATFAASIETFRENWDSIKIQLEDQSKCYIEIEIENKSDVEVLEEVLLKLRQCYFLKTETNEDDEAVLEEEDDSSKDLLSYNFPQSLCETNIYCPFTYFNYGVLWEGKQEFSLKYDSKIHYFGKEEFLELFQNDVTKYQAYNKPFKKLPQLRVCIMGCLGSGTTALSRHLATELGLMHIDFKEYINYNFMPRHFKKVGRRYENPFKDVPLEEEAVVEFQMDEENPNLLADILSNETELRRMIYNYYERGQPMIPILMHQIIQRLWFDNPYVTTGFLIDGYPRVPQDIEDLVVCNCIPDLIIDLDSNVETVVERLSPIMFDQWKSQFKEAKEIHRIKLQNDHNEWMKLITKKVVIRLILEEILDTINTQEAVPTSKVFSYDSFVYDANPLGSLQVDPNLFNAYNELIAEYPEQIDTREWEKSEDVREGINSRLEAIHETEYDNIQSLKEVATDNKIKLFTIDGSKPLFKVCRIALAKLSTLKNRSQSFFEQTIIITNDIAEILLSQGYCFLSKFGRLCPVYIYENQETIFNSYKISRRKGKLFPVIHRAYIYFISSEDSVNKFRVDPLKYITSNALKTYYAYPLRIGIIGAPKSGKSSLSVSLARRNNLMCISRGMILRYVLEQLHWTQLASNIIKNIENGEIIDTDLIMNALETVAIDHRVSTYGFVLDGFPSSSYEAVVLSKNGLYPNIIFDISSEKRVIVDNSQNEIYLNILKYKPSYSLSFMEDRFSAWNEQSYKIRQWVKNDYNNICVLNGNESKWQCLQVANNKIRELISDIHYYLANVETSVVPASAMSISNEVFEQKQSGFRNLCPACVRKNIFRHSGYNGDKTGVVQFKNKFYWICTEHLSRVLQYPRYYLLNEISIPEVPAVVKIINTNNVYENGICIVTYAENLPAQSLQRGTNKFAVTYKHKTYLFCSETCLHRFLDKPHLYSEITVFKESSWFSCLPLKKLPHLGYLEQTLANILTQACCAVNVVRPKYPGLSFQVSALIYIGLYMNSRNGAQSKEKLLLYQKALKKFEQLSKLILELGLRMRSMENPFSVYPKCNHLQKYSETSIGMRSASVTSGPF